jgi:hypothetical protein
MKVLYYLSREKIGDFDELDGSPLFAIFVFGVPIVIEKFYPFLTLGLYCILFQIVPSS